MTTFHDRLAAALQRRLFPHTGLQIKQVAGAIGQDGRNLSRWINGESKPFAEVIEELGRFFASRGDHNFIAEVYGIETAPDFTGLRASLEQVLGRLPDEPEADRHFWIVDGALHNAPAGLAEFARRTLDLSIHVDADLVSYMMRMRGAVAVIVHPNKTGRLRYAENRVDPLTAARACEWLRSQIGRLTAVGRDVLVDGRWVVAPMCGLAETAEIIEGVASVERQSSAEVIERLPLEEALKVERFKKLLNAYSTVPAETGALVHAATDLGILPTSSILRVDDGGNVFSLFVGPKLNVPGSHATMGRNVMERADTRYADMVRFRGDEARKGPTFYELDITIAGEPVKYRSLALPDGRPGRSGLVITSSEVLSREGVPA